MRKRFEQEIRGAQQATTAQEIKLLRLHEELSETRGLLEGAIEGMRLLLKATRIQPRPGVYFLLDDKSTLLYVGQSESVAGRMVGHSDKQYSDAVMLHVTDLAERNRLERLFVHYFTPPLNVQLQAFNRILASRAAARAQQRVVEERAMLLDPAELAAFDASRLC